MDMTPQQIKISQIIKTIKIVLQIDDSLNMFTAEVSGALCQCIMGARTTPFFFVNIKFDIISRASRRIEIMIISEFKIYNGKS